METHNHSAADRMRYVRKTLRRMNRLTDELGNLVQGQPCGTASLWDVLNDQERASRQAGFAGVSRLCQQMRSCLQEAAADTRLPLPITAKAMLAVCRSIRMHAESMLRENDRLGAGLRAISPPAPHAFIMPHSSQHSAHAEVD